MKKLVLFIPSAALVVAIVVLLGSCRSSSNPSAENPGRISTATGLEYNADEGFQVSDFGGQPEGPNLVFIEGGERYSVHLKKIYSIPATILRGPLRSLHSTWMRPKWPTFTGWSIFTT